MWPAFPNKKLIARRFHWREQMSIALSLEQSYQKHSHHLCVVEGDQRLTYGQVEERVNRLARALAGMGVKRGHRVGILQINCFQYVEILYAIAKIGAIFVSLNFRLRGQEISYIMNNAGAKVLILGDRYADLIQSIRGQLPWVENYLCIGQPAANMKGYETLLSSHSPAPFPSTLVSEDETACIMYTSGTTGLPKGAMLTHGNILSTFTEKYAIPPGTLLVNVPIYHIAGALSALRTIQKGDPLIILPQFDPGLFLKTIEKEKVATTYLVPTMLRAVLDHPDFLKQDLRSLKNVRYGAAPMPIELLLRAFKTLPVEYFNAFGLTEATATISALTPGDHRLEGTPDDIQKKVHRLSGVGRAIPEVELRVVDDQDRDTSIGQVGEVIVRGKKVMKGYWKNPADTEETLRGGWLHTGDLVRIDEDGYMYLAGRKKDMIIRGGGEYLSCGDRGNLA